jgi:serine/threonine-protein kinase RsbW
MASGRSGLSGRFAVDVKDLPAIKQFVAAAAEQLELTLEQRLRLALVTEELAVNIMNYSDSAEPFFTIEIMVSPVGKLKICFVDFGEPFNPLESADIDVASPLEERNRGGLGLFLVKQHVRRMTYQRKGNRNMVCLEM